MASPQYLRPFLKCYDTSNTNDPSFKIGCCQARFSVLIFDHSATTYSALDVTPVPSPPSSNVIKVKPLMPFFAISAFLGSFTLLSSRFWSHSVPLVTFGSFCFLLLSFHPFQSPLVTFSPFSSRSVPFSHFQSH